MLRSIAWSLLCVVVCVRGASGQTAWPGEEWETATPASQGMDADGLQKARAWLETHNSKSGVVIRHGRIVAEWYFGGADRNSQFAAYSTSKSLSSMATGLAIADGKLALDHTVGKYLPDASPETKRDVTVKQLLSMTTGVHNDAGINQRDDLFSYAVKTAAMDNPPGAKWDYNNTGLSLLSPVFSKATGQEIDDFLNARVFRPIGIRSEDWKWERREGHTLPYSGWQTTARSLGRIGLLVLHHGKWQDKQVVPAAWLTESAAPSQELNKSYGYLWWNNTTKKWPGVPADAFAALGKWDNNILVVPSLDLIVIRQSDLAPAAGHQIAEYFQMACEAVAQDQPVKAKAPTKEKAAAKAEAKPKAPPGPPPTLANVEYGDHARHKLDFYKAESKQPTPLLFFIHGGGWTGGDKGNVGHLADYLKAGVSVVSINYRYVTQAQEAGIKPPVQWPLHDAARALQFVRSKAGEWNIDKTRIGASGGSAGACSSLWLAFHDDMADPKSSDPIARESTRLLCAGVNGAQTTLDPKQMKEWTPNSRYGGHAFGFMNDPKNRDGQFQQFLDGREKILPWIKEYSPYELVSSDDPPIYLYYSTPPALGQEQKDPTHTSNFGVKLQERLRDAKVACELVYPGAPDVKHDETHLFLIATLTGAPAGKSDSK